MSHTLIILVVALVMWPFVLHTATACLLADAYMGREHAQAEYRAIKRFYGGKRANATWWCGFEPRGWDRKSILDWIGPLIVAIAVSFI